MLIEFVFALHASLAGAAQVNINWGYSVDTGFTAHAGDTLVFTWSGGHSVALIAQSNYASCNGAESLDPLSSTSGFTYKIPYGDATTTIYFSCTLDGHCASGVKTMVQVLSPLVPPVNGGNAVGCYNSLNGCENVPDGTTRSGVVSLTGDDPNFNFDFVENFGFVSMFGGPPCGLAVLHQTGTITNSGPSGVVPGGVQLTRNITLFEGTVVFNQSFADYLNSACSCSGQVTWTLNVKVSVPLSCAGSCPLLPGATVYSISTFPNSITWDFGYEYPSQTQGFGSPGPYSFNFTQKSTSPCSTGASSSTGGGGVNSGHGSFDSFSLVVVGFLLISQLHLRV